MIDHVQEHHIKVLEDIVKGSQLIQQLSETKYWIAGGRWDHGTTSINVQCWIRVNQYGTRRYSSGFLESRTIDVQWSFAAI
ncbi:hypothetical protein CRE_05863 [Caenorhabditis remanei]|uniref:Uncharacterized protein n=1 Tax=Caenorhabditis remanei TaxID=31234 RepID=E3MNS0_CAERE|nr:hypothetical protein CRE_05863 [Caenorhabditis remanei]